MQNNSINGELLVKSWRHAGLIRLNRPKALNSLSLHMVRDMKAALDEYDSDPRINCIILSGAGECGLCAGGDVKQIYAARDADPADRERFWREEFPLNHQIANYSKPYVALMDGIVMGGGVGISAHGSHRIVTNRTRLAMPETAIGYFPDVGATWLLPKAPGETGTWLGLTGAEVGAADAIYLGLADYHVPSDILPGLLEKLVNAQHQEDVVAIIRQFSTQPQQGVLAANRDLIDSCFGFESLEQILAALEASTHPFATQTRTTLLGRSPTSLTLTLRLLRHGRLSSSLKECLEREFIAGCEILRGHDFYEGVRAALIDKDGKPDWAPSSIDDVTQADIDRYFGVTSAPLFS